MKSILTITLLRLRVQKCLNHLTHSGVRFGLIHVNILNIIQRYSCFEILRPADLLGIEVLHVFVSRNVRHTSYTLVQIYVKLDDIVISQSDVP